MSPFRNKSLYTQSDYRAFLKGQYLERKSQESGYSYARFASDLGFQSASYIQLIITGKRDLTIRNLHQCSTALGFDLHERSYFEALVLFNQAQVSSDRGYYLDRLRRLANERRHVHAIRSKNYSILAEPHTPAILASVAGQKVAGGVARASRLIGLGEDVVRKTLKLMEEAKVISERDGLYQLDSDYLIVHDKRGLSLAQKVYLRSHLEKVLKEFEKRYPDRGKYFSQTFTIGKNQFELLVDRIAQLLSDLVEIGDSSEAEELVHINVQFFPWK